MEKLKLVLKSLICTILGLLASALCFGLVWSAVWLQDKYGVWFTAPLIFCIAWVVVTMVLWDESHV